MPTPDHRIPSITHRQLALFRAIMHHGQLGRAAAAMGSSQPTLSRDLARLEQVLGFDVFDRISGRLRPTARGLALLQEVERSFIGLDHIAQRAVALRHQITTSLRLACLPALAHALVPKALALFASAHPQAIVRVLPQDSPWLDRALAEQQVDIGLSETNYAPAGCTCETIYTGHEVAVLPLGHALLGKSRLDPQDFADQRFISLAPGDTYRAQIDSWFDTHHVKRQLVLETDSAVAICAMVSQGLGLSIVNPLTAQALMSTGLGIRPLSHPIAFEVSLVTPQNVATHPLQAAMVTALKTTAKSTNVSYAQPRS